MSARPTRWYLIGVELVALAPQFPRTLRKSQTRPQSTKRRGRTWSLLAKPDKPVAIFFQDASRMCMTWNPISASAFQFFYISCDRMRLGGAYFICYLIGLLSSIQYSGKSCWEKIISKLLTENEKDDKCRKIVYI